MSSDTASSTLEDDLKALSERDIYVVRFEDDESKWREWRNGAIASFEEDPAEHQEEWQVFSEEIKQGDILIAQGQDRRYYTYGMGVAEASYDPENRIVAATDTRGVSERQIPVDWRGIVSNGEVLTKDPPDEFPDGIVSPASSTFFWDLLHGLEAERGNFEHDEYAEWLLKACLLSEIDSIIDAELPDAWSESTRRKRQIRAVVKCFLRDTSQDRPTAERRQAAQQEVRKRFQIKYNTVQAKCGREIWEADSDEPDYQQELFDPALERIEQAWIDEQSGTDPEEFEYFILVTGDGGYGDTPESEYYFENSNPGTKQLREAEHAAKFVYYEDKEFYALGEIGEVEIESLEDAEEKDSVAYIKNYREIDPIPLSEVQTQLSTSFPKRYGIVKIDGEDYALFTDRDEVTALDRIGQLLEAEKQQAPLYREALAHLVAGKNLIFHGPPGTGKTRAARLLTDTLCADASLATASADWSNHKVVGGYAPADEGWASSPGLLTQAVQDCRASLEDQDQGRPSWLIIDELNRANLDEAFGDVFTLLDLDYREQTPLEYAGETTHVPLSFRILGTINTYDQAQLFSLGYAFRRRFAFVAVPSLLDTEEKTEAEFPTSLEPPERGPSIPANSTVVELIEQESTSFFQTTGGGSLPARDVAPLFTEFTEEGKIKDALQTLNEEVSPPDLGLTPIETLVYFAEEVTKRDVVEIGQAILIDAAKFLLAHQLLFPNETDWDTVDQAVVAYLVPQFEQFMSELRRAETIDPDSDAQHRYDEILALADTLELTETVRVLARARETKQLLES